MNEFIERVTRSLGIPEGVARSASAAVLGLIRQHAAAGDFRELLARIPGAEKLAGERTEAAGSTEAGAGLGGALGGALGRAASQAGLGGSEAGAAQALAGSGLAPDKYAPFLSQITDFIREKAGPDLAGRVLGAVPGLGKTAA